MERILHIRPQHAVYVGDFGVATPHRHGAIVLLVGLSGPIKVHICGEAPVLCRSALIDANVEHAVDCRGEQVGSLYFELGTQQAQQLRQSFLTGTPAEFDVANLSRCGRTFERHFLRANLSSVLSYSIQKPEIHVDPRILSCIEHIQRTPSDGYLQSEISLALGLSNSRLNHLFKQQTGVSYRHFKLWSKLAFFVRDFRQSASMTESAMNSGFSDSAHASNSFRKMFGLRPSDILGNLTEFDVWR